jgi:hypothetical protein
MVASPCFVSSVSFPLWHLFASLTPHLFSFFSPDLSFLSFRSSHPADPAKVVKLLNEYLLDDLSKIILDYTSKTVYASLLSESDSLSILLPARIVL